MEVEPLSWAPYPKTICFRGGHRLVVEVNLKTSEEAKASGGIIIHTPFAPSLFGWSGV
jgi:hypothetical protein